MDAYRLAVKFFFQDASKLKVEDFVPVYHRWIQNRALADHLLIDVGAYGHVREGPGTVLVGHQANLYADLGDGRLGFMYVRKHPLDGPFRDRLRAVFKYALSACAMLEDETGLPAAVKFRTDEAVFRINDRLLAPNSPQSFEEIKGDLQQFLNNLYSTEVELKYQPHAERLFEVDIRASQSPPISTLLERVGAA